jgi:RNA polymerase sigma-70 factor (ECF subfamily)
MSVRDPVELAKLQAMDESEWKRVQDDYFKRIYFFVRRYVSSHQTAEDLTQDVFVGAIRGIERFDPVYSFEQYLFGIARNRVIDHFRKHKLPLVPPKGSSESTAIWLENMEASKAAPPASELVNRENAGRRRAVLGRILKEFVGELWDAGEFRKLMVLEYLFVLGGRNKDAAVRFGIDDEKAVAGIKFRAVEKLRGLARQNDPNHSLFGGLWMPGAR